MSDLRDDPLQMAVARVMREPEKAPDDLRAQIQAMMAEESPAPAPRRRPLFRSMRIGFWAPLAAAAMLLITAAAFYAIPEAPGGPAARGFETPAVVAADSLLTAADIDRFAARHNTCTRDVSRLVEAARFPMQVEALPEALADYFHASLADLSLDLSRIGYRYRATGLCSAPGPGAVHLTYAALSAADDQTPGLSLWIRPDDGRLSLEEGRLYLASHDDTPAVLIWRRQDMVFYLMGDDPGSVDQAVAILRTRG